MQEQFDQLEARYQQVRPAAMRGDQDAIKEAIDTIGKQWDLVKGEV